MKPRGAKVRNVGNERAVLDKAFEAGVYDEALRACIGGDHRPGGRMDVFEVKLA